MNLSKLLENIADQGSGIDKKRLQKMKLIGLPGVPSGNNGKIQKSNSTTPTMLDTAANISTPAHNIVDALHDEKDQPEHSGARIRKYMGIGIGNRPEAPSIAGNDLVGRPKV